jgi:CBS-domain-containing membrane protein
MINEHADPNVPGSTRLQEACLGLLFGGLVIGMMSALAHFSNAPFIVPSLGATAFLVFYRPNASAASPRNALQAHTVGVLCGLFALSVCGLYAAPPVILEGVTWARTAATALSLGTTSGVLTYLRRPHPPAGATTLIVSMGLMPTVRHGAILITSVVILIGMAAVLHRLAGTPYPVWAPAKESG